MAAVNSQPLQTRPFEENVAAASSFQMEDDDGEFEYGGEEAMVEEGEEEEEEEEEEAEEGGRGEVHHASAAAATAAARGGVGAVTAAVASSGMRTSELTLSFEGEVYVFPAVTAQKVQAVLLLLGGRDVPISSSPAFEMSYNQNIRGIGDIPKRSNLSRRIASLVRFREKRKERCFDKKIRYTVRKEVAQRMHRKNGQFASLKENSGGSGWESAQSSLQDGTPRPETALRRCQHCGVSESNTPAMRRGPAGPRTLCNACGLMWANKGTLRDLSKGGRNLSIEHIEPGTPLEMKPSVVKSAFSGNQNGHGTPEDPSKLVIEGPKDASVNRNMEICLHDLHEAAEDIMNAMPMGIVSSTNDDDQETLLELTNTSDIDLDIPTNFD